MLYCTLSVALEQDFPTACRHSNLELPVTADPRSPSYHYTPLETRTTCKGKEVGIYDLNSTILRPTSLATTHDGTLQRDRKPIRERTKKTSQTRYHSMRDERGREQWGKTASAGIRGEDCCVKREATSCEERSVSRRLCTGCHDGMATSRQGRGVVMSEISNV